MASESGYHERGSGGGRADGRSVRLCLNARRVVRIDREEARFSKFPTMAWGIRIYSGRDKGYRYEMD